MIIPFRLLVQFLFFVTTITLVVPTYSASYTFEDLNVLLKDRAYVELLDHAFDPVPTTRGDNWTIMVGEAGELYLKELISKKKIDDVSFSKIARYAGYQPIIKNPFFFLKLTEFLTLYIHKLKEDGRLEEQREALSNLIDNSTFPYSPTHLKFSELVYENDLAKSYYPLLLPLLLHNESVEYCDNTAVLTIFTSELLSKSIKESDLKNLSKPCLSKLFIALEKKMNVSDIFEAEAIYQFLKPRHNISDLSEESFLIFFFLMKSTEGELLNRAWSVIKKNGESFARREAIFQELSKRGYYPSELLKLTPLKRRSVLMSFFNEHYPEYFKKLKKICDDSKSRSQDHAKSAKVLSCELL